MKNCPFSWSLVALSLAFWFAQVMLQLSAIPQASGAQGNAEILKNALLQLLPYAIICSVICSISLGIFGNWLLCFALVVVAAAGIGSWWDYVRGGGCMKTLALAVGFAFQGVVAVSAVLLALTAKGLAHLRRRALCAPSA
jgi:hypothetical protein